MEHHKTYEKMMEEYEEYYAEYVKELEEYTRQVRGPCSNCKTSYVNIAGIGGIHLHESNCEYKAQQNEFLSRELRI